MKVQRALLLPFLLSFIIACQKQRSSPSFSFSPAKGPVGALLTLNGPFGADPVVKINGVPADSIGIDNSYTKITCRIPAEATSGRITVSFGNNTLGSGEDFIVTNKWMKLTDNDGSGNIHEDGVSFVLDKKIYFGLGYSTRTGDPGYYTATFNTGFRIFDPAHNTWSAGPQLPPAMIPRTNAACFALNGKAYIGCGNDTLSDWWQYDPVLNGTAAWRKMSSNTAGTPSYFGGSGQVAFIWNNTAYAGNPGARIYQFDPAATNPWIPTDNYLSYESVYGSYFVSDNYLYIIGGFYTGISGVPKAVPVGFRYDLSDHSSFFNAAQFPAAIEGQPSFALDAIHYILFLGSTFRFDPVTQTWIDLGARGTPSFQGGGFPYNNAGLGVSNYTYNATAFDGAAYAWTSAGQVYKFVP